MKSIWETTVENNVIRIDDEQVALKKYSNDF